MNDPWNRLATVLREGWHVRMAQRPDRSPGAPPDAPPVFVVHIERSDGDGETLVRRGSGRAPSLDDALRTALREAERS